MKFFIVVDPFNGVPQSVQLAISREYCSKLGTVIFYGSEDFQTRQSLIILREKLSRPDRNFDSICFYSLAQLQNVEGLEYLLRTFNSEHVTLAGALEKTVFHPDRGRPGGAQSLGNLYHLLSVFGFAKRNYFSLDNSSPYS